MVNQTENGFDGKLAGTTWVWFGLIAFSTLYLVAYACDPNVPGAHAKGGWEGWWDQSRYLLSARAFAALNFSQSEHHYPPGYSLLAAPFVRLTPVNPFVIPNFLAFLAYFLGFMRLTKQWVHPLLALICFGVGILCPWFLLEQYVHPWNTIPVAALMVWVIALIDRPLDATAARYNDVAIGFLAGCAVAIRPSEAIVLLPLGVYYLFLRIRFAEYTQLVRSLVAASLPILFVGGVSLLINGGLTSSYALSTARIGFSASNFANRALYILLDASTSYNEPGAAIRVFQPFVIAALPFAALAAVIKPRPYAISLAPCAMAIALYITYNDFNPMNIVRYLLVHYIQWTFPIIIVVGIAGLKMASQQRRYIALVAAASFAALLLFVRTKDQNANEYQVARASESSCGAYVFSAAQPGKLDIIDFIGASIPPPTDPTLAEGVISSDQESLSLFRDYRFLNMPDRLRLIFNTNRHPRRLEVKLPDVVRSPPCQPTLVMPGRIVFG